MEEKLSTVICEGVMVCVPEWMMIPFIETGNTGELDIDLEREMQDIGFWKYLL